MKTLVEFGGRRWKVEHLLLAVLMAAVVALGILNFRDVDALREFRREMEQLQTVLRANEETLSAVKDLESGQRGYLLTGDPKYLQPYRRAKENLPGLIDTLSSSATFPGQEEKVERLMRLLQDKIVEIDATLALRDTDGEAAALSIVRTDEGRITMESIRDLSAEIRDVGYSRMIATVAEAEARSVRSKIGLVVGCSVLSSLVLLTLSMIRISGRRGEESLRDLEESRRQFYTTLASIGDGVITTDATGHISFMNRVASQLTGWNPQEAEGQPLERVFTMIHDTTGVTADTPVRQAMRTRTVVNLPPADLSLVRRDGSRVPVGDSGAPILDIDNNLLGAVMVFRDVSEQRALNKALSRWEHVFYHAGFGMAILTSGEHPLIEQANEAFSAMHGYTSEELIGQPYIKLVAPEVWPIKATLFDGSSRSDHSVTETVHVRKDGSRFPAMADFTLVRNDLGAIMYSIGYYLDISDRKRSEEALRQSEERYRTTADSLPQLIWTAGTDGITDYLNQRWVEETGLSLDQTGPEGWTYFLATEDRDACIDKWKEALRTGETFQADCRFRSKDQTPRWYTCRAVPIRGPGGEIMRWFGSCTDVHEQKIAAEAVRTSKEELQVTNEALKRSNTDLEQFAYAASHDLQEPLRMIGIYSQLLHEEYGDKLDEGAKSYMTFATQGAIRMEALLKDLLAYSRAATQPSEDVAARETDSQEALNEALVNLGGVIEETNAQLTRAALPTVRMPRVHLVQIFQNLIGNALKYRKPGEAPAIHVDVKPRDGMWIFSVRDNGIGIDPQYQQQVFRIFGRLHGQEVSGTGVGLAICKKLVDRAGGVIWVESKLGEGSTFLFTVRA